MTTTHRGRETLTRPTADILHRLPEMGRVMLTAEAGGATHERIGAVETVEIKDGFATLRGACHDSRLDLGSVSRIVADRTGRMGEKAMPRLDFQNADGATLYAIIGLGGLEPFDVALAPLGAGEPTGPRVVTPEAPKADPTAPANDLGAGVFNALFTAAAPITIELHCVGLTQAWHGVPPEPRLAMGFVNVMQGDFHLHLKAGAVTSWCLREDGEDLELHAEHAGGGFLGLVVRGPRAALAELVP